MRILVDVNLSPAWIAFMHQHGWEAVHWSDVGDVRAPDSEVMRWARDNDHLIFTHDLDFSALLAATHANGPSVLQVRTQDVLPGAIGEVVLRVLDEHGIALERGAILTVDLVGARVRFLPIARSDRPR